MSAPKKPVPRTIRDSAMTDDGWALSPKFDMPRPQQGVAQPADQRATPTEAKGTSSRYKRPEDWFDEVDLGWCLPGEDKASALPPSPLLFEVAPPPEVVVVAAAADEPTEEAPAVGKLDLNSATSDELLALPGVGHKKAGAILTWRKKHGRFDEVADLTRVSGFGAKTVDSLADYIGVRGANAD